MREVRAGCEGEFGAALHKYTPVNYSCARTHATVPHAGAKMISDQSLLGQIFLLDPI